MRRIFAPIAALILIPFAGMHTTISSAQTTLRPAFSALSFDAPVDIQDPGDGSDRLFVVEQEGIIYAVTRDESGATQEVFLDIQDEVRKTVEEGLLGLAFHPEFATNRRIYVYHTDEETRATILATYTVSESDPNQVDASSREVLLTIDQPYPQHNAGQLRFGPDGYLYISTGDGGGFGDERGTGEDLTDLLGSILRIDVNREEGNLSYGIPPDNPFVGNESGHREEIYAYGLRNPWRFSFDRADFTSPDGMIDIWVGDVGSGNYEEINRIRAGRSYGWEAMEGPICHNLIPDCDPSWREKPVWYYGHDVGRAIIGGFVYRGKELPWLNGRYVYGDYSSGRIWALEQVDADSVHNEEILHADSLRIYAFGEDTLGELYVAGDVNGEGRVFRLAADLVNPSVEDDHLPQLFTAQGSYPNPFRTETQITYTLQRNAVVEVTIYDSLGRRVTSLVHRRQGPGREDVAWDGTDDQGRVVAPGIYFIRLSADGHPATSSSLVLLH